MTMLDISELHTYYGDSHVLQGLTLRVERGSCVAVLGRNGVGKTTLMRSITGTTRPRAGRVIYKGKNIAGLLPYQISRMGIALVPQGRRIFPSLTVRENLSVAARRPRQANGHATVWDFERVFTLFPRLAERLGQRGGSLSGGEQQMLATARALVSNPDLLLMDEPSEGLAPMLLRDLGEVMDRLKQEGLSILLVEQKLPFALRHADDVYVMSKGAIVYTGSPEELWRDETVKSRYLGVW
jgi:branched-chain amino acid transport system ATP-binding protein